MNLVDEILLQFEAKLNTKETSSIF